MNIRRSIGKFGVYWPPNLDGSTSHYYMRISTSQGYNGMFPCNNQINSIRGRCPTDGSSADVYSSGEIDRQNVLAVIEVTEATRQGGSPHFIFRATQDFATSNE